MLQTSLLIIFISPTVAAAFQARRGHQESRDHKAQSVSRGLWGNRGRWETLGRKDRSERRGWRACRVRSVIQDQSVSKGCQVKRGQLGHRVIKVQLAIRGRKD